MANIIIVTHITFAEGAWNISIGFLRRFININLLLFIFYFFIFLFIICCLNINLLLYIFAGVPRGFPARHHGSDGPAALGSPQEDHRPLSGVPGEGLGGEVNLFPQERYLNTPNRVGGQGRRIPNGFYIKRNFPEGVNCGFVSFAVVLL